MDQRVDSPADQFQFLCYHFVHGQCRLPKDQAAAIRYRTIPSAIFVKPYAVDHFNYLCGLLTDGVIDEDMHATGLMSTSILCCAPPVVLSNLVQVCLISLSSFPRSPGQALSLTGPVAVF